MTAAGTTAKTAGRSATPAGAAAARPGPVPRRVRPPRWLDLRLVLGVLLVLGSVLVGARVVTAADATVSVWAAADDLAAGTVLTADDLIAVDVRLEDTAGSYLATSSLPEGDTLARSVGAGELLPRSVLAEPADLVQLALPVQAGFVPPSLERGQVVDVYAVASSAVGATVVAGGEVTLVVGGAPVQAISGRTEGVLSTATTTVQVVVSVAADDAPAVLAAIGGRPLVVVVHDGLAADPAVTAAPPGQPVPAPASPAEPAVPAAPSTPDGAPAAAAPTR